jgi:NADH-quinone oxidoreductase subunit M
MGLLSLVIFLPLLGAVVLMLLPKENLGVHRYGALLTSIATFATSLLILGKFSGNTFHFQLAESIPWIPAFGITYKVGIDGISLWLLLLTTFIAIIAVWFSFYVKERTKEFMVFLLILETAMLGVFCALDLVLFYVFFEATLIPMYFLIAIWGGGNRIYSGIKFFLFTFLGSIFMLVAILYLGNKAGTFDLAALQQLASKGQLSSGSLEMWLFAAFALAFAVKVPMFPVHTWLPDAHTDAPTAGSIVLAAVMLKMGVYGFIRFCLPLFPEAAIQAAPFMMGLAVVGIIYGAIMAAIQPDWKRLVAYSSVSHLGFIMLGLFALNHNGLSGAVLQSINHGISTGALFLMVGMIYERTHTRLFKDYGGLKRQMPMFAMLFLLITLSSVGLPSMNGFIGEFLAMLGAFQAAFNGAVPMWMPVMAGSGVVLAAVYLLWMFQKVFYGPTNDGHGSSDGHGVNLKLLRDIKPWEQGLCWALVAFVFWFGLYPSTFTSKMEASLNAVRHQTLLPAGLRPAWADVGVDINSRGDVVAVERPDPANLGEWNELSIVAPAHHQKQASPVVAVAP